MKISRGEEGRHERAAEERLNGMDQREKVSGKYPNIVINIPSIHL